MARGFAHPLPGWDKATLVDKERTFSVLLILGRVPGISYHVPIVPAAEAVYSHGQIAQW